MTKEEFEKFIREQIIKEISGMKSFEEVMKQEDELVKEVGEVIVTSTSGEIDKDGYDFLKLYPQGVVLPAFQVGRIENWLDERTVFKDGRTIYRKEEPGKQIFSDIDPYGEENWEE